MKFSSIIDHFRFLCMGREDRYCHVAGLIKSNSKLIKYAFNDYNRQYKGRKVITALHAEQNCVVCSNSKNCKLIVVRFDKNGNLKDSKPCSYCKNHLIKNGFKHIYCSLEDGTIGKIKLADVIDYLSNSQKKFGVSINGTGIIIFSSSTYSKKELEVLKQ